MSKTKFTKVAVSERLPSAQGMYMVIFKENTVGTFNFWNEEGFIDSWNENVDFWLEESPDREEEMREMLERIQDLKPLIQYPDDTKEEHEGEAKAINSMLRDLDSLLQSLKQEK